MTSNVDISVSAAVWSRFPEAEQVIRRAVAASESAFENCDDCASDVSVLLCDDEEIRRLNRRWRGKDSSTNVLSFPTPDGVARLTHLGDIAIAFETVDREAREERKTFADHLSHLTVHGYLHLVGFDHEVDEEAEEMESLEREILARLDIADPYDSARDADRPNT